MGKFIYILLLILQYSFTGYAQYLNVDSVRRRIQQLPDDTAKVNRMNHFATSIMSYEPIIALETLKESRIISEKINFDFGLSVSYGSEARLLFYKVQFDSCRILLDKAFILIADKKDKASLSHKASLIHTYGNIYQQKQLYDSAVVKYLDAVSIFNGIKEDNKACFTYFNLSGVYIFLEEPEKALYYAKETNRTAILTGDSGFIMRGYMALADAYIKLKQYDTAFSLSQKGLYIAERLNNVFGIGKFYSLLGTYHVQKTKQYDKAIDYFKKALVEYNSINIWYDIALLKQLLGSAYLLKDDYSMAVTTLKEADAMAVDLKLDQVRLLTLSQLVEAEEKMGNINASYQYLKMLNVVKDSVQVRNNRRAVEDLEAKYQTQKKELQLTALEKDVNQKRFLIYLFGGAVISLSIISLLSYRNYKQKQKLQQQKIFELEKEKQLLAAEAVLEGQEQERIRLAKDLHDSLGGMLSGIRHSFTTIKENLDLTEKNAMAYERGINMLDTSIKELRTVAHNLMPESLVRFGLDTALKDFCESITGSGMLKVNYHSFGTELLAVDKNIQIILYRIIQELVNNIMKHAHASEAIVQLQKEEALLTITVEDNGKGFDENLTHSGTGIGWSNIKNRVEYLKGKFKVVSDKEHGSSITIEIPL